MKKGVVVSSFENGDKGLIKTEQPRNFLAFDYSNTDRKIYPILKRGEWVEFEEETGMLIDTALNIQRTAPPKSDDAMKDRKRAL